MAKLPKIYNSRILKLYIQTIHEHHPEVDVDDVLRGAGISRYEVEDQGHWFSQEEIDAFYTSVVKETGNPDIAREAGRCVVANETSGPVKQVALGLLQVSSIYLLLPKLYPTFSRGAAVKTRKLTSNRVEICVTTLPEVQESPHQCANRVGIFESLCLPFTGRYATVEHTECLHDGGHCCRYVVNWDTSKQVQWKRLFSIAVILGGAASGAAMLFWPVAVWLPAALISGLVILAVALKASHAHNQELAKLIQSQGNVAEDHIREIDYRYQASLLVQKIGRACSAILDRGRLAQIVVENIEHYLDFDRGMIMLANENRTRLVYSAGYGFDASKLALLEKTRFRLDNPDSKGVFVKVFNSQRPVLVEDINALSDAFSERSRQLIHTIGSKSMICLPIVHKDQSLGILAVDNIITKRPLTKSDMNLLMAVAYQTAVSIFSANAFNDLQSSEERYRSLYENAPTAYISVRIDDASIVDCNAAAERLLGYDRGRLIGSSLLNYVAKSETSRLRAQKMQRLLINGQSIHNEALEFRDRSGESVWVLASVEPFKDADGTLIEGRCILVDTTEQRHLEEQLRKAQQMEAIGTLAGGVAHDLSNILAAIVGYPDLLLMDVAPDSPMHEPLVKLRSAGSRAAAIVQDLLTLSRRGVAIMDVVDLNAVLSDYLGSPEYDDLFKYHPQLELVVDLTSDLKSIKGSSVHLIKTIMNVIHNAAEALDDAGTIRVSTRNQFVAAGDYPENDTPGHYVVFSVEDNGHGIAPEDLKCVFEPFFTKKVMGRSGTGLGMAIVWGVVQDHNGFIDIRSELGKGTVVDLFFPATDEQAIQQTTEKTIAGLMGRGERILVADHNSEHRDIAERMLSRLGYDVLAVGSGPDVLRTLKAGHRPDLILLDSALQSVGGRSLLKQVRECCTEIKAVLFTGLSKPPQEQHDLSSGSGDYVKKPYNLRALAGAVRSGLDRRTAEPSASSKAG